MYTQILDTADAVGQSFRLVDDLTLPGTRYTVLGMQQIVVDIHTGGIWTLQHQSPAGVWIDTDITFTDVGVKGFYATQDGHYRLSGGSQGARAFVTGAWDVVI